MFGKRYILLKNEEVRVQDFFLEFEKLNRGIKPDRAVKFLSKVLTVADESENALKTAEELLKLRTCERVENVEKKIQQLDMKIEKPLLSERWKCELEGEKDVLKERLANLKEFEKMKAPLHKGKHNKENGKLLKIL